MVPPLLDKANKDSTSSPPRNERYGEGLVQSSVANDDDRYGTCMCACYVC